jgi:hypothetical protein
MIKNETVSLLTVPLFSGAIGYLTNWSGVWMLFNPVRFKGFRFPGLKALAGLLPAQVPADSRRNARRRRLAGDHPLARGEDGQHRRGHAKLGSPGDFYEQLEPDKIAEHSLDSARGDVRDVERIMEREHPALWRDLPPRLREGIHERVQEQLPEIIDDITREIGTNIDQLLDVKLMVIRRFEEDPAVANRIFQEMGHKELRFIINSCAPTRRSWPPVRAPARSRSRHPHGGVGEVELVPDRDDPTAHLVHRAGRPPASRRPRPRPSCGHARRASSSPRSAARSCSGRG